MLNQLYKAARLTLYCGHTVTGPELKCHASDAHESVHMLCTATAKAGKQSGGVTLFNTGEMGEWGVELGLEGESRVEKSE